MAGSAARRLLHSYSGTHPVASRFRSVYFKNTFWTYISPFFSRHIKYGAQRHVLPQQLEAFCSPLLSFNVVSSSVQTKSKGHCTEQIHDFTQYVLQKNPPAPKTPNIHPPPCLAKCSFPKDEYTLLSILRFVLINLFLSFWGVCVGVWALILSSCALRFA